MPGPESRQPDPVPDCATQYMVRMRDGVRLATDVYLPTVTPAPTVLVRLPYDKNSRYVFMEHIARRLTARGYALVVQDVRGKYRSEGNPIGPLSEVRDGFDTIDWVSKQVWCTGDVGTFGDSYYGFTQWAALTAEHPAHKAMVPRVTSMNLPQFSDVRHGDVIDVPWLAFAQYVAHCWTGAYMHTEPIDFSIAPLSAAFERFFSEVGERSLWFDLMIPHDIPVPVYGEGHPLQSRPIPTLHCVGWFDNLATLSMRDYMAFRADASARPYHFLYANSCDHENYHLSLVPIQPDDDHDSNNEALERMLDVYVGPAIDFFDVFLAKKAPADAVPPVRWDLGHVGFRESDTWPPADSRVEHMFLTGLKHAAASGGSLSLERPAAPEEGEWVYDPADLAMSTVQDSFAFLYEYPDESSLASRSDVLTFESEPLAAPLDLAGPIDLYVRVSSTSPTTDIYAKLCDRGPDGTVRQIVRGQGVLLVPGAPELSRIEMGHTGYRVRPGHRLHLQVMSSDYPEFPPNSGTDADRWTAAERVGSRQTMHTDPDLACHLSLSVVDCR